MALTVEVTVRITAEVEFTASSHPGAEDAVDDLVAALLVADHAEVVATRIVPDAELEHPYAEHGNLPPTQEDTHG